MADLLGVGSSGIFCITSVYICYLRHDTLSLLSTPFLL